MMKKFFYTILALSAIAVNAQAQGMQHTATGVQYQIINQNPGEKIKLNDVITFNVVQRTDKDSVLFSSYQQGQPVKIQVRQSTNVGDMMDVFQQMTVKDSAVVKIPVDSVFKGHEAEMPPFFKKGGSITCTVKIERVQNLNDAIVERNAAMAKYKADEIAVGDAYIKANHLVTKATPSGLRYVITKLGKGPKPLVGDSVAVNYVGRTARGKVFDTSIESAATAAGINQPGRPYEPLKFVLGVSPIIKGWEEGLQLLNEGSKATLIIPAALAYGEQGAGDDIKPYNTLVFDVELVKVVRGKHAAAKAATPAAKTKAPVKKRTAVKKKN